MTGDELLKELVAPREMTPLTDWRETMALLSHARDSAHGWPRTAGIARAAMIALEVADRVAPTSYHARTAGDLVELVEARRAFRDHDSNHDGPHVDESTRLAWLADVALNTTVSMLACDDPPPMSWRVARVRLLELVATAVVALDEPSTSR